MAKLLIFHLLLLVLLLLVLTCKSSDECITSPSSCGHIPIISYPFRLNTDPINCGNKQYEISCDDNVPMLYNGSEKYHVRSINYNNFTIRLSDASLIPVTNKNTFSCNGPLNEDGAWWIGKSHEWYLDLPSGEYHRHKLYQSLVIINCPDPIPNATQLHSYSYYADGTICSNKYNSSSVSSYNSSHRYARVSCPRVVGIEYLMDYFPVEDLVDSCLVELILKTSMPPLGGRRNVLSYKDVYDSWEYGFELFWFDYACCYEGAADNQNPCNYLHNMSTVHDYLCIQSNIVSATFLRPLLVKLRKSALGSLLAKFRWDPSLYYDLTTSAAIVGLLKYALLLFVLYHATLFSVGVPFLILLLLYKWRRRHLSFYDNIEEFLQGYEEFMPVRYSYREIKKITKGFKDKLGEGGYGSVYKGTLRSGHFAAVKMLGKANADGKEFINEVATIGRICHVNVVRLIGFCAEGSKRALIYEFMPNGSLDKYVFSKKGGGSSNSIGMVSNEKMCEIALGVARGIEYLHRGCEMQILHFDIKPHNILLDENFIPKISDFGLAKLYPINKGTVSLTAIRGTMGYMAPEFFYKTVGKISYKADVYSFGKMLMEMAARKRDSNLSIEHSSQIFFPSWVHDQYTEGKDVDLGGTMEEDKELQKKMIIVGLWCVQLNPIDRPTMRKVLEMLEGGIECLQLPPKPFFAPQQVLPKDELSIGINSSSCSASTSFLANVTGENEEYSLVSIMEGQ